jgi:hypothetical protein
MSRFEAKRPIFRENNLMRIYTAKYCHVYIIFERMKINEKSQGKNHRKIVEAEESKGDVISGLESQLVSKIEKDRLTDIFLADFLETDAS